MKKIKAICLMTAACCLYGGFLMHEKKEAYKGEPPKIQAPETVEKISVRTPVESLLKNVTATDKEDGDLTNQVFVESISDMDDQHRRTVTYGAFDSSDQAAHASQQIQYTDYAPPEFTIEQPMMFQYLDSYNDLQQFVGAKSVLDGDLSDQVVIEKLEEEDDVYHVTFSVADSSGQESRIVLKVNRLRNEPSFKIELKQYLLRVSPGTVIKPERYIKGIGMMGMDYGDLIDDLEIRTDYDADTPGIYEFIYYLERPNGDFGTTKLVVIVE